LTKVYGTRLSFKNSGSLFFDGFVPAPLYPDTPKTFGGEVNPISSAAGRRENCAPILKFQI